MTSEEQERRAVLAAVAVELGQEVTRLTVASEEQSEAITAQTKATAALAVEVEKKTAKTTIKIRWMIALVIMDLILSGAMLVGYIRISDLIKNQEVIRAQVLCPMYKIFLGSYQPETRAPGPDRDKYEAAFKDMWGQYAALQCTGALVPPRNDLVTTPAPK